MIHPSHPVVDLGCGTGRFAEQLRRRQHGIYAGIDFSKAALAECRRYVPTSDPDCDWHADFQCADLRHWQPHPNRASTTIYTCLETLEHLDDDISLVRRIPVGHDLIFSVPNYGGEAHLRVFQNVSDAWERYDHLLTFSAWIRIGAGPQNFVHLYRATRRPEAW